MFTFDRTFIGDILIKETGNVLKNCKLYEVFNGAKNIGRFYSGGNFSFIETDDRKFRIEQISHFINRTEHLLYDQYTQQLIGQFSIPDSLSLKHSKCFMYLLPNIAYEWEQDSEHKRIQKKDTWDLYRFNLLSVHHKIVYYGRIIPNLSSGYLNPDQHFRGEIQTTNDSLLLPIFAGISIMEQGFRRIEQDFT